MPVRSRKTAAPNLSNLLPWDGAALLIPALDKWDEGLVLLGPDGLVQWINLSARSLLEIPADEPITSKALWTAVPVRMSRRLHGHLEPLLRGSSENAEWVEQVRRGDRWLRLRVQRCQGNILLHVADFTRHHQDDQRIQESENRYRLLAENSTDMISLHDPNGVFRFVSPAVHRLLGYEPPELIGKWCYDYIYPDDTQTVVQAHRSVLTTPDTNTVAFRFRRKDESYLWIESTSRRIRDSNSGDVVEIQVSSRDVSERKEAEAKLLAEQESLEQRVRERTQDLEAANDRLRHEIAERREAEDRARQKQAELEHVARLSNMGEMASGIAHELNQPLAAIINYAKGASKILQETSADRAKVADALSKIAAQGDRAAAIIRRLRDFVTKRKTMHVVFNLNDAIRDLLALVGPELKQRHVAVSLDADTFVAPVLGDPIQLEQVVLNLVRNATQAMAHLHEARRRVVIKTSRSSFGAEISVRDYGTGIAPELLERVFDPFFSTSPEGMGMGLTISRTLVEAHGGRLWAANHPNGGAIFTFTIPSANAASMDHSP